MKKNIKVSIVMPNYNSSSFLEKTIKSVLKQNFSQWELIIVDDNSDTKTKEFLRKIKKNKKIRIFFLKINKGAGYCRNLALNKSNSKYVAFLDSDDIWEKNKLRLQINLMEKYDYDFTYTFYSTFKRNKNKLVNKISTNLKFDYSNFIKNTSIATSTIIIKKELSKNIKFTSTPILEDYFFKCQLLKKIKYAYCLNKFLTKYRIRNNSLQSNKLRNFYWLWLINSKYNKLNFFDNLLSVLSVSVNSIKKYGFK